MSRIHIEPVPKLDKVLRVTFSAVKKDLHQLRDEFTQIEDRVDSTVTLLGSKLEDFKHSAQKDSESRYKKLQTDYAEKYSLTQKQLSDLHKDTAAFIKKTNSRVVEWNTKIRKLSDQHSELGVLLQEVKLMQSTRAELERLPGIEQHLLDLQRLTIKTKDFEKFKKDHKKDLIDTIEKIQVEINLYKKEFDDLAKSLRKEQDAKISILEAKQGRLVTQLAENQGNLSKNLESSTNKLQDQIKKLDEKVTSRKKLDADQEKSLITLGKTLADITISVDDSKKRDEAISKQIHSLLNETKATELRVSKIESETIQSIYRKICESVTNTKKNEAIITKQLKTLMDANKATDIRVTAIESDSLQGIDKRLTDLEKRDLQEIRKQLILIEKQVGINSVKPEGLSKDEAKQISALVEYAKLNKKEIRDMGAIDERQSDQIKQIASQSVKHEKLIDLMHRKLEILSKENSNLKSALREAAKESQKMAEEQEKERARVEAKLAKAAKSNKVKVIVKEEPKKKEPKEPREFKPGFWQKIIDFLVEDIEDEKDSKLAEFDRKKGDKFQIREIKE